MNSEERTAARITRLEDDIAYIYTWYANNAPGVQVRESGALAEKWAELDFLYLVDEDVAA